MKQRFYFCPKCGGQLTYQNRRGILRLVCGKCQYVLYENPVVGVAAVIRKGASILLGRRSAWSTYPGLWCIPCGYVEYDEDVYAAIRREFLEETGLAIETTGILTVLSNFHNPETHTVGIWFDAKVAGGELVPGDDLDAAAYFPLSSLPPLAFPTDQEVINMLISGQNPHTGAIIPGERKNQD